MLKQLFRDSVAYAFGRVLTAVIGILLLPVYTAHLRPNELGLYDMGNVVIAIASLLVALEIAQGAARYYCEDQDLQHRREYFTTALGFTVLAFAVFSAVAVVAAPYVAKPLLGPDASAATVVLVAAAASATAAFRLGLAQLRWMLRPIAFLACSVLQVAASAAVAVGLVVLAGYGAHGLLWGLVAGNAVGFVVTLWLGRSGLGMSWSRAQLREMLAFSIPLVSSGAAVWVALYVDRLAIKQLLTMADVGVYGVAYRFAGAVDIVMVGFDRAFMPLLYANYRDPATPATLAKLLRLLIVLGGAILLGVAAGAHELLHLFATPEYASAAGLIPILASAVLLSRIAAVAPGLWVTNRTRSIALINVAIALTNLALNFALIPLLGVAGAAVATATSALLGLAINMSASQRHYPVPHDWPRLIAALLVIVLGVFALLALGDGFAPLSAAGMAAKAGAALLALALCAAVLLTAADRRDLGALVRKRLEG